MEIKLKSNYDKFSKQFLNLPYKLDSGIKNAVEQVLKAMCKDMKKEIEINRNIWFENGSGLDAVDSTFGLGDDIEYECDGFSGTIYVGRNTPKLSMKDGRTVNPYLFIEFGYGIEGANSPAKYHTQNKWEYNINNRTKSWWYAGFNGEKVNTSGRVGINFFYNTIAKYREKWKDFAREALLYQLGY